MGGHACIATFMATIKQLDNNDDFDSDNTLTWHGTVLMQNKVI